MKKLCTFALLGLLSVGVCSSPAFAGKPKGNKATTTNTNNSTNTNTTTNGTNSNNVTTQKPTASFVCKTYRKKKSGLSGKEASSDVPDWVKGKAPCKDPMEDGNQFATRMMNEHYPEGWQGTGPTSEYNKIKKYADRGFDK